MLGSSSSKRDQSDSGKHHDRDSSRSRKSHHHHRHSSSSRKRHDKTDEQLAQAVKAALVAGAAEALRSRKEPGDWTGEKGRRILTAAITAGGTDGLLDRDPDKHNKRHIIESVLAGLATNRVVNGKRSRSGSRSRSHGRGRSESRGAGLKDIAATGALAAAGKEIYKRVRSKSRGRQRSRSRDSYDSRSPPRHRGSKKRSQSMSETITKGLAAIGLSDREKKDSRRRHERSSRYSDDSYDESDSDNGCRRSGRHGRSPSDGYSREVGGLLTPADSTTTSSLIPSEAYGSGIYGSNGGGRRRADSDTDSDLGSSSDEKRTRKKMHRKELLTAGLATVATIHAAHNVVESMEKRKKRRELLEEGEITPEEARKRRIKANLADAASIGLAALGIKGAVAEWKEANAKREESKAYKKECQERTEKRAARRARSQSDAYPRGQRYLEEYE